MAQGDERSGSVAGEAARILAELGSEGADTDAQARAASALHGLGEAAIPVLFDVLRTGRAPAAPGGTAGRLDPLQTEAVASGLGLFGRRKLVPFVKELTREPQPVDAQLAALELLGRVGEEREVDLAVQIALSGEHKGALDLAVADRLRECAVRMLERDPRTYGSVGSLLFDTPLAACGSLIQALKQVGGFQSLQVLTDFLGTRAELDHAVLVTVGSLAQPGAVGVGPQARSTIRDYLHHIDEEIACAAAVALGRLEDAESIPALIERLEDAEGKLLSTTHVALKRTSGENLRPDPALWRSWLKREQQWYEEELPALEEDLFSDDDDVVVRAMMEISKRRLHRHDLAELLLPQLDHPHADVRKLACNALSELGSTAAVPALADTLDDGDPAVASTAWDALTTITGMDLPAERTAWKQAISDGAIQS